MGSFAGCSGLLKEDPTADGSQTAGSSPGSTTDSSLNTAIANGDALRITEFSYEETSVRQTDVVTLTLTVANEAVEPVEADLVFQTVEDELHAETQSIPSESTTTVTAQRELLQTGEYPFQAAVVYDGAVVATVETSISVDEFPSSFVGVEGTDFTLNDGTIYLSGADANSEFLVGLTHPHHKQLRPLVFDGLEHIGASVLRLFVSTAPVEYGGPFPGEDNEKFFRRFDMAVTEAKRRNIRLSIPIMSGGPHYDAHPVDHLVNHVPGYVYAAETAAEIDDFYRNEECIELYKEWVEELLTHENHLTGVEYRHDPTIMMWELGNEIAWTEPWTRESQTLRPWIEEAGPYVKDLAPDQLLTTGVHGWPDGRNDFVGDYQPDCIDACSLHYWVGPGHYDLSESEAEALLKEKIEAAHDRLEKPLWFSEYNWGHPAHPDSPGELADGFLEERNGKLEKWHTRLDESDVAATAVHQVSPKEVVEGLMERKRSSTTIYPFEDDGTVEELRRYARLTREKSTATAVPELADSES